MVIIIYKVHLLQKVNYNNSNNSDLIPKKISNEDL